MFRCKVCGWIHEGATPPDACPSCGASADRFRAMDTEEVELAVQAFQNDGIVGQGFDIDVEDTRRIRLLAFVDASFFSPYTQRIRQALSALYRRCAVVLRQHSVHDGVPVAHRYLPLHRPDRRWSVRRQLRAQPRAQCLPGLPGPNVRPPLRRRLPPQGSRCADRHLLSEARRRRLSRRNPPRGSRRRGTA